MRWIGTSSMGRLLLHLLRSSPSLLYGMGQLMCQEMLSCRTIDIKLARIKINIISMGKCLRMQVLTHLNRHAIIMHPDLREINAKGIFHLPYDNLWQGSTCPLRS